MEHIEPRQTERGSDVDWNRIRDFTDELNQDMSALSGTNFNIALGLVFKLICSGGL
jgi:hypothetical protein